MKTLLVCSLILYFMTTSLMIYDFKANPTTSEWTIVNDGVMGGESQSSMQFHEDGYAVFSGQISLENNGGFASVRHKTTIDAVQDFTYVNLKVKGKPATYQMRFKKSDEDAHSYVQDFRVTSGWETIQLKLSDFYPRYRGRSLNLPNFEAHTIREVAFLIGNQKEEEFQLDIDKIYLSN